MGGFIDSFKPLVLRYKSEVILLSCAFCIGLGSLLLYSFQNKQAEKATPTSPTIETHTAIVNQTITVDISGAVRHPFVYTLDSHARIIDAIQKAGGITEEADAAFVKRSVNYARILSDQEKIYIPFLDDVTNGLVMENKRIIDYTQPSTVSTPNTKSSLMNINSASVLELDQLPGVGPVIAEAIFKGHPYTSLDDLVKNEVIKQSVYDKIKGLISVY